MIAPRVSNSLPRRPTSGDLLHWLKQSDLSVYKHDMQRALERLAFIPEDVRSMTAKMWLDTLSLPNFGVALHFVWTVHLSEVSEHVKNEFIVSLEKLDDTDVCQWLRSENLFSLAGLFHKQGVTGKAVVALQPTDLTDMGFTDRKESENFFKA